MDKANDILGQVKAIWSRFTAGQKFGIVGTLGVVLAGTLGLTLWAGRPDFRRLPLAAGADPVPVMARLDEEGIEYRVLPDGRTILVDADRHEDARRALAQSGLLAGAMEDEDKGGLFGGQSPLNKEHQREMRAREAEKRLAAALERYDFIERAKVTITPSVDHPWKRGRQPAKANVQIATPGVPSDAQIQSITHVVMGGVAELQAEHVTISDMRGTILKYAETQAGMSRREVERQRLVEFEKARKAQEALDFVYGDGKTHVTISADIDWTRSTRREKRYDPESGVTRQRSKSEDSRTTARGVAEGPVGSNVPSPRGGSTTDSDTSSTSTELKDYDSTETELVEMGGDIKRLSAAVFVDDSIATDAAALATETKKIEEMVAAAIGLDATRGDTIKVHDRPIAGPAPEPEAETAGAAGFLTEYGGWIETGLYVLLAVGFLGFALRAIRRAQSSVRAVLEKSMEEEAAPEPEPEPTPIDEVVLSAVRNNADLAGRNVRRWLYETAEA